MLDGPEQAKEELLDAAEADRPTSKDFFDEIDELDRNMASAPMMRPPTKRSIDVIRPEE